MTIAAICATKNEADIIEAFVRLNAKVCDAFFFADDSTDGTPEILDRLAGEGYTVHRLPRLVHQGEHNQPRTSQLHLTHVADVMSPDWIFSLDADERVTPELAGEARALLASAPAEAGFRVPRVSWYLGRWIRSTDWYPDYQLRLYDRRKARWAGRYVHESVRADGAIGRLRADLQHYPYRDVSDHLATIDRYATLAARQMREDGRHAGAARILLHPAAAFLRNYVLRGGFRDGTAGLIVSLLNAHYVGLKFVKLWEEGRE